MVLIGIPAASAASQQACRVPPPLGCPSPSTIIARLKWPLEPGKQRRIDLWWRDDATGRLALLLAYLINPLVVKVQKKIRNRTAAVFVSLVLVVAFVLLVGWLVI